MSDVLTYTIYKRKFIIHNNKIQHVFDNLLENIQPDAEDLATHKLCKWSSSGESRPQEK